MHKYRVVVVRNTKQVGTAVIEAESYSDACQRAKAELESGALTLEWETRYDEASDVGIVPC